METYLILAQLTVLVGALQQPTTILQRLDTMNEKFTEALTKIDEQAAAIATAQGAVDALQEKVGAVFVEQAATIESLRAEIATLKANGVSTEQADALLTKLSVNNTALGALATDVQSTPVPAPSVPTIDPPVDPPTG
jgi:hypothetical protein